MKHKYIDELVGRYYLFPEGEDKSDIATSKNCDDIAQDIPTECAKALIKDRDLLVDALTIALDAHGDEAYSVFSNIREKLFT